MAEAQTPKLVEWVKGSHLVMDRFDKYYVAPLFTRRRTV